VKNMTENEIANTVANLIENVRQLDRTDGALYDSHQIAAEAAIVKLVTQVLVDIHRIADASRF
jgi:hypothetical protein